MSSREITQNAQDNARQFAVFHVAENGKDTCFLIEEDLEFLQVADYLRQYIHRPPEIAATRFAEMFANAERISREQFDAYVRERMENTGRVVGAFDIDFDQGHLDALNIMDGWQCFKISDVSTAANLAMNEPSVSQDEQWRVFLNHLEGKQLTYQSEMCEQEFSE